MTRTPKLLYYLPRRPAPPVFLKRDAVFPQISRNLPQNSRNFTLLNVKEPPMEPRDYWNSVAETKTFTTPFDAA
ncbi:MAG: hypothetical protein IKK39_14915, partial [Thermoguttaceae bacterium]|nr:hypothetical protein [Thermoguttaceae bacterium]